MSRARDFADLAGSADAGGITGRNMVVNGAMQVAQRSTSVTGITTTGYRTVDRYQVNINAAGTWSISQSTTAPTGFANSLKMDCTTADASLAAGDYVLIKMHIEGQDLQQLKKGTADAEAVTASFWVRSAKTGTYTFEIVDGDNSRTISASYTISAANTWEYKTITFPGDTTGTLDNDANSSFQINWWLAAGTDFTSGTLATAWASQTNTNRAVGNVNLADSTSNDWYMTGFQLEVGEVATPFEHRSYGDELARCQRYFEKSFPQATAPANNTSLSTVQYTNVQSGYGTWHNFNFAVPKRAAPTMTAYNPSSTTANKAVHVADNVAFTSTTLYAQAEYGFVSAIYGGSGDATGNKVGFNWDADAEL